MKLKDSNILLTVILPVYLNIFAAGAVRNNSEKIIQENPRIYSDESSIDDKVSNFHYYDAYISESIISGHREAIFYDEYPLILYSSYESILSFIDLPPPEHKS